MTPVIGWPGARNRMPWVPGWLRHSGLRSSAARRSTDRPLSNAVDAPSEPRCEPQCFLEERELVDELARGGFVRDDPGPLTEYNAPRPGDIRMDGGPPVIYEGTFVRS